MTIICGKKQIFQSPNATMLHFIFFDDDLKYRSNYFSLCLEKSSTFLETLNLEIRYGNSGGNFHQRPTQTN